MRHRLILGMLLPGLLSVAEAGAEPLEIIASPIALHEEDDRINRVGRLEFLGGLRLSASDERFGGLSGLVVSPDGRRLSFVTDAGSWIRAAPRYDSAGRLVGMGEAEIGPLLTPQGQPVRRKRNSDAESLFRTPGGLGVSFEHKHRFWFYGDKENLFRGRPKAVMAPNSLGRSARNRGIEAAVMLPDGRLFALAENFPKDTPHVTGWLLEHGRWHSLTYERTALFHPTGAAVLPNGDVLILERRFTFVGGFATRLVRVPAMSLKKGNVIKGVELARLEPPFVEENFEGLDVRRDRNGRTVLYFVSDDNFFPLQKTLLLMFAINS